MSTASASKIRTISYWVATLWLCLGMVSTGIVQLLHQESKGSVSPPGTEGMIHLGYPLYLLTLLGVWKLLGSVAVLLPKTALLKEWAYAGFFFCMSGAIISHLAVGDAVQHLGPALLLFVLTVLSWYLRPDARKLVSVKN